MSQLQFYQSFARSIGFRFFLFTFGSLLLFATGCGEVDVKLVNQIKTFGPQWIILGDQLAWVDRNLELLESRLERDYNEVESLFSTIPDSLRAQQIGGLIARYETAITERDSLRKAYTSQKEVYLQNVERYSQWEKKVMEGEVSTGIASSELTKFKQSYNDIESSAKNAKKKITSIAADHNAFMADFTNRLSLFTNYSISLK